MRTALITQGPWIGLGLLVLSFVQPAAALSQVPEREALLRLNRELLESVFLRQDTALLASAALPSLLVVPPGGIVEDRAQVLAGVRNVAMDSVRLDDVAIASHSNTAVVITRVSRLDVPAAAGSTGRSRIMSVFVYDEAQWRLLARSVTPCVERATASGRC